MKYYPELGEERAYVDTEICMGCGNCVIQCPIGARAMKLVQPPEFIPDEYVGHYLKYDPPPNRRYKGRSGYLSPLFP